MPIDLGLARVARLLNHLNNPHLKAYKAIHLAGTNGKGSTVSYLSSILTQSKIRNGRFTSPHILHYNDCVSINNETYPLSKFQEVSKFVQEKNRLHELGCTEFELLTVTAFKIFEIENVEIAVIEVGLGGRLDATNVLEPFKEGTGVIATGITKIGIDHESFLGDTLAKIAFEKAGIIKEGIPCVVDRTNHKEAVDVVAKKANELNSPLYQVDGLHELEPRSLSADFGIEAIKALVDKSPLQGDYQKQNLSIALKIIELIKDKRITKETITKGIETTTWRGRLQSLEIPQLGLPILLDGAHNESAAIELGKYLTRFQDGFIFIIAITKGKAVSNLLKHVINKTNDKVICTSFTSPESMPWVSNYPVEELKQLCSTFVEDVEISEGVKNALEYASKLKQEGDKREVVVFGSLYLCGDVLRLVEESP
ncbi:FolC bifunctional protein [Suhomyces tanzawaensis NRRL Y-17324]|uniref:Dihydrofolate synthetase n=1 Tax=Suhomyces tanzawaensis NRRL Y-17324 TaxID=984487 RepID=A0A1E4SRQ7_9ASCO|nr:FolC bifunctional protein [Suhomyces tanzawaensis NRRL Y-17324]ODV82092.1 FolC bifunctional protein [Suhomyces tanzawaensis NRRL Y-17324]